MKVYKYKVSKYYESDIWGVVSSKGKINKSFIYFRDLFLKKRKQKESIFNISKGALRRRKRKKIYGRLLYMKQRLYMFYGGFQEKKIRRKFNCWKLSRDSNTTLSFFSETEMRLDVLLYRSNFSVNIFHSKDLIKKKLILVNREVISDPNYYLRIGDIVEVLGKRELYFWLFSSIKRGTLITNYVKHIEVCYSTMSFMVWDYPRKVSFLFKLNKDFFNFYYYSKL